MLALPDEPERAPMLQLDGFNFGPLPLVSGETRLGRRFYQEAGPLGAARQAIGTPLDADAALGLGLVTAAPDDIDWDDEVRIAIEERAAMSPDALTGLEANLRFAGTENMATRVFGRLTAWQNWIFQRPNAVGDKGALKVYGTGEKPGFDFKRV
jgi:benzoyl-CoA-dihydrodiol lyase